MTQGTKRSPLSSPPAAGQLPIQGPPLWLQLSLLPAVVGIAVLLLVSAAYYLASKDGYLRRSEENLLAIGELMAETLDRLLAERVRVVRTLAVDELLLAALRADPNGLALLTPTERRQRLEELDLAWREVPDDARIGRAGSGPAGHKVLTERLFNPLADLLQSHMALFPGAYAEIFVTDRFGAVAASTGRLATPVYAHTSWWQATRAGFPRRIHLDDRGYDEALGDVVLGISMPLSDGDTFLGVLQAKLLMRDLLDLRYPADRSFQFRLVRSGGDVLLERGPQPVAAGLSSAELALARSRIRKVAVGRDGGSTVIAAVAPVQLTLSDGTVVFGSESGAGKGGEHWNLMVRHVVGVYEVLGLPLPRLAMFAGAVLLGTMVLSGWLGWRVARPINRMTRYLDDYSFGSSKRPIDPVLSPRTPREVRQLDRAFRDMAGRIVDQAVSIEMLWEEVRLRKRAEARQRHLLAQLKRSNAELASFAYVASHDLQEPLRMISGYLQLIERRYRAQLDEKGHQFIDFAVDGARRMSCLIEDLLLYSRVTTRAKPFAEVDASKVLEDVLRDLGALITEHGARIAIEPLPVLNADATQLHQLLQNLVANAVKFRDPARMPVVRIGSRRGDAKDPGWILTVADNGIGIEQDYYERIFGVFQRLHTRNEYPGTGIGLAVCKKIAERHGGWIRVQSEPGVGSCFEVFFPDRPPPSRNGDET